MTASEPIRVAIVEDDRSTREGLGLLIDGTPGYRCVGKFNSVEDALRFIDRDLPDVLLLDIHLPGMLGSEGVRCLKEKYPQIQILMLTIYAEEGKIFESICNGACGYLLKKTTPAKLLEAIGETHRGGAPMSPEIARKVIGLFQRIKPSAKQEHNLTSQEVRLLRLLAEGHSYQSSAGQLVVSINTVRNYIRSIYDKLHVHSKGEAVGKAFKSGII